MYPYSLEGLQLALKEQCGTDSPLNPSSIEDVKYSGDLGGETQKEIYLETKDGRRYSAIAKGKFVLLPYDYHFEFNEIVSVTAI